MAGPILGFTSNYNFAKLNFDAVRWGNEHNKNFDLLDAVLATAGVSATKGFWKNSTIYTAGDRVVDVSNTIYLCKITHTSPSTGAFSADRTANPTRWELQTYVPINRGTWTTAVTYTTTDIVLNGTTYYLCILPHTSGVFATDLAANKWTLILDTNTPVAGMVRFNAAQSLTVSEQLQARSNIASAAVAGNALQTFSVAPASANDHAVSLSYVDARYARIVTSPTALTSGQTIPNTVSGRFYSMAFPAVQTCALPSITGLPDGFTVVLRATGSPASFQQAFVNGNGKLIYYRGSSLSVFYLVGNFEVFKFTWFAALDVWIAECLSQPSVGINASFTSNVTSWTTSPTAWTPLPSLGNTSSFATNYSFVSNLFSVAATGIYTILGYAQFSAGAGGGVSGIGYVAGGTNSGSDTSRGFSQHSFNTADGDGATLQVTWTEVLHPNELRAPYLLGSASGLSNYLAGNYSVIKLVER